MIYNFIFLLILNLSIIYFIKKIAKIANIFDIPDRHLKLHKKKNSNHWRDNFDNKLFNNFLVSNLIFKKFFSF